MNYIQAIRLLVQGQPVHRRIWQPWYRWTHHAGGGVRDCYGEVVTTSVDDAEAEDWEVWTPPNQQRDDIVNDCANQIVNILCARVDDDVVEVRQLREKLTDGQWKRVRAAIEACIQQLNQASGGNR